MTKTILLASIIVCSVLLGGTLYDNAFAALNAYVQIDGEIGESQDKDHKGWSDLQSFSWGATTPQDKHGKLSGKRSLTEATVVKPIDKTTPKIMEKICQGKKCTTTDMTVDICRTVADGNGAEVQQCYLQYELKNVQIVRYRINLAIAPMGIGELVGPMDIQPTESFALNFEKIIVTYTPYDDKGNAATPIVGFYDKYNKAAD